MRVLVADNDPDALDLLLLDLRLEGHTVAGAASSAGALTLIEAFAPDVVVLDHRMPPGATGLDTALQLQGDRPELPVLLYSNYQDPHTVRTARERGIPLVPKGNLRTLRAAIAGYAIKS